MRSIQKALIIPSVLPRNKGHADSNKKQTSPGFDDIQWSMNKYKVDKLNRK